mmetsp:Transcript_28924/g.48803  ORF Transcript_28924/g.48803 Transcript_28924/m.48803 type:complete len:301 (+) Transcript_28924:77-979(+)
MVVVVVEIEEEVEEEEIKTTGTTITIITTATTINSNNTIIKTISSNGEAIVSSNSRIISMVGTIISKEITTTLSEMVGAIGTKTKTNIRIKIRIKTNFSARIIIEIKIRVIIKTREDFKAGEIYFKIITNSNSNSNSIIKMHSRTSMVVITARVLIAVDGMATDTIITAVAIITLEGKAIMGKITSMETITRTISRIATIFSTNISSTIIKYITITMQLGIQVLLHNINNTEGCFPINNSSRIPFNKTKPQGSLPPNSNTASSISSNSCSLMPFLKLVCSTSIPKIIIPLHNVDAIIAAT